MVRQFQFLQQALHVVEHLLMALAGVFGLVDAHELHLGELMQPVEAAHVLAVGAGLAAEALGVGAALDGQLVLGEYLVAEQVGHRHLGGGDEVEIVHLAVVHLALLVWQLARAVAGSLIDHRRRLYLLVAGLDSLVEEEVDQRPLQASALAGVDGEARAGDLDTEVEIDEVVFLGELPVRQRSLGDGAHAATLLLHHIVGGVQALGHLGIGNIGDVEQQAGHLLLRLVHACLELLGLGLSLGHGGLSLLGGGLVARLHQSGYLAALALGDGQRGVELRLSGAAYVVLLKHGVDILARTGEMFLLEAFYHPFFILCDLFDSKHIDYNFLIVVIIVIIYVSWGQWTVTFLPPMM